MNQPSIKELKAGAEAVSFFVLRKKEIRTKHDTNEFYLALELGDASGRIRGSLWDEAKKSSESLQVGDVVKVKFRTIELSGHLHLHIDKIRKAEARDEPDVAKLVPVVPEDRKKLLRQLDDLVGSVGHRDLQALLRLIFEDPEIRDAFANAPAGKLWHHGYLGGLLEHTLAVTNISEAIGKMYSEINRDLLVAGGLLHDIGKIHAYSYKTLIDYTDEGRLLGHIVQGVNLVDDKIKACAGFPDEARRQLLHLILSHQGKLEQASPVVPMTVEAMILYFADEIDSKINAMQRILNKEKGADVKWSSYVRLLERYLYFGEAIPERTDKSKGKAE